MSSRALRRLQRELEEHKQAERLQETEDISDDDQQADAGAGTKVAYKPNAFEMLNNSGDPDDEGDLSPQEPNMADSSDGQDVSTSQKIAGQSQTKKRKKGKKKKQQHDKVPGLANKREDQNHTAKQADIDEIDLALLSIKSKTSTTEQHDGMLPGEDLKRLYQLLAVDTKYLNALNEMKRLFGNVVLDEGEAEAGPQAPGRRRDRGRRQLDLGGALAARNSPVSRGQGLVGLALRRNVFMIGKESWPKATSGGLGMEIVEKAWDLTTEYRFVHSSVYQDVQKQFYTCVDSMDPQRMIQHLQYNPYHISTLLVVSEIADQQGDHSVAGELLERALFSFGRSVHSSFPTAMAEGKARLDFRRPENREFWLIVWRYIKNLGQRGTWRTVYEWAKLLLSLDPEDDPYCVHLVLDQLALRCGQSDSFINLAHALQEVFPSTHNSPNIEISLALAEYKAKLPEACRKTLKGSVLKYPWIFARLFQELNIGHTPKAIWGKEPHSPHQKLETEAYVTRAKDLWNTPEAISLLVEVVESLDREASIPVTDSPISMNEARHILLSETPSLITLLPREFTTAPSTSYDVLPPEDSFNPYAVGDEQEVPGEEHDEDTDGEQADAAATSTNRQTRLLQLLGELEAFVPRSISSLRPFWGRNPDTQADNGEVVAGEERTEAEFLEAAARAGITPELFARRVARFSESRNGHNLPEDSEDSDFDHEELAEAIAQSTAAHQPTWNPPDNPSRLERSSAPSPPSANSAEPSDPHTTPAPYDDERNQRWLAGQGMLRLRDFTDEHGLDETAWSRDQSIDIAPLAEYALRVTLLKKKASRNFILDYALQQGTSSDVKALVVRTVTRMEGSKAFELDMRGRVEDAGLRNWLLAS